MPVGIPTHPPPAVVCPLFAAAARKAAACDPCLGSQAGDGRLSRQGSEAAISLEAAANGKEAMLWGSKGNSTQYDFSTVCSRHSSNYEGWMSDRIDGVWEKEAQMSDEALLVLTGQFFSGNMAAGGRRRGVGDGGGRFLDHICLQLSSKKRTWTLLTHNLGDLISSSCCNSAWCSWPPQPSAVFQGTPAGYLPDLSCRWGLRIPTQSKLLKYQTASQFVLSG